ncbi:hypothetical protein OP10G_3613 [Fimbriimonas ginsengisoli Gsoil 348]|uniref:Uncharacterized protein n=1 Tax=Fimbriimonas ginsengisoli Gsoil 348 TaxID=661478 RepID=A0A068NU61_FIMGI|nr:hypothetical protein OP10G_3613 [Fimbriimonas ginsengisoli Gsoil 348]
MAATRPSPDKDFNHSVALLQGQILQLDTLLSAEFRQVVIDQLKDNP